MASQTDAWSCEAEVDANGRIEVTTPLPPHARVTVVVREQPDEFADLTAAAQSTLEFWDNPMDDEDWNDAGSR